jgi:hypothetical protein
MSEIIKLREQINEIQTDVTEIKIALKGYNGNTGLLPAFRDHCVSEAVFRKDFYSFRRRCFIFLGIVLGSGAGAGVGLSQIARIFTS